jgi:hypothetical protein
MPWTPYGVSDHEPLRERAAVMGTGGADREEIVAASHHKHGFFADMPPHHTPIGKVIDCNALCKIGTGRAGLRCSHDDLQRTLPGETPYWGMLAGNQYIDGGYAK